MSFYGFNSFSANLPVDPEKLALAETELQELQRLHENILTGCKDKCLVHYHTESELSKGESTCVDRCSSKFFRANLIINEYMRNSQVSPEMITAPSLVKPSIGQHGTLSER